MNISTVLKLGTIGLIALCMPRSTARRQVIPAAPAQDAAKIMRGSRQLQPADKHQPTY